jgi:two-component sensor histidine kinase
MTSPLRAFVLVLLLVAFTQFTHASRQGDSLQTTLDGMSTSAERANALLAMARAQSNAQPGESLQRVMTAVRFAERAGDLALLLRAVRQQRELELKAGAYDQFLLSSIRAVSISERRSDPKELADDMRYLAQAYERTGGHDKAIETSRKALFLLKGTGDSAAIGRGITDLLYTLVSARHFAEVLQTSTEALAFCSQRNDSAGMAQIWLMQAEAMLEKNKPADAMPHVARAERYFRAWNLAPLLLRSLCARTQANIALARWDDAHTCVNEAFRVAQKSGAAELDPRMFALASQVHSARGDLSTALAMERRHTVVKDSLFDQRMTERMIGLQALYGSARQEAENAELRLRSETNEVIIDKAKGRSRLWAFGAILLAAALVGLFLIWRKLKRSSRRSALRTQVIQKQTDEIRRKNMELERQNLRLAETLLKEEEKDVLLKHIHHRVKNDLQIVNTLLKMQGSYIDDARLAEVLSDCQGRVRSLALVHEHIYRCGDLSRVNVKAHLSAMCEGVLKNYGLEGKVSLNMQVNYDQARMDNLIPLSLLVNELITNSAKHAFNGREHGQVNIQLRNMGGNQYELVFSDDGIGLERSLFFQQESFGLELVRTLASQLDGRIRLLKGEGTTFQMSFSTQDELLRKAS